jgi:hypothetical protein
MKRGRGEGKRKTRPRRVNRAEQRRAKWGEKKKERLLA